MASTNASRPAWQTDELEEEWIEPDDQDQDQDDVFTDSGSTRSISLTAPLKSSTYLLPVRNRYEEQRDGLSRGNVGTVLIREDVDATPLLPKTPGRGKNNGMKDFFTPLALEKMFEPPSPPVTCLVAGSPIVPSEPTPSLNCQFTFTTAPTRADNPDIQPWAQSTPGPVGRDHPLYAPGTDPRLRLFHFQYDTFTRDHLSAMVDSIAVNTPSGSTGTPSSVDNGSAAALHPQLSRVSEASNSISRLRSTKRIRLSPTSDYGEGAGAGANVLRPTIRRDYVSESKSLMEQIKQARLFSTVSTHKDPDSPVARADDDLQTTDSHADKPTADPRPHAPEVPNPGSSELPKSGESGTSKKAMYSSLGYRRQAADLMAQIRNDMKGSKRVFSGETVVSHATDADGEPGMPVHSSPSARQERASRMHDKENKGKSSPVKSAKPSLVATRSRPKGSPRKQRRPSADWNNVQKAAYDVPNVAVFAAWSRGDEPKPVVGFVAPPSTPPSPRRPETQTSDPGLLAPPSGATPSHPTASLRARTGEDLNRFVSSSTASGTTLTAGSSGSYCKHAGPAHITHIGPEDIPTLPERVGKMIFDKVMMKWVKDTANATAAILPEDAKSYGEADGTSEDPFRDIESLGEDDGGVEVVPNIRSEYLHGNKQMTRIDEAQESELEDEEELQLTSFSIGDPPTGVVVQVMTGDTDSEEEDDQQYDEQAVDSEEEEVLEITDMSASMSIEDIRPHGELGSDGEDEETRSVEASPASKQVSPPIFSTPLPPPRASSVPTPILRSALKSESVSPNPTRTPANQTPGHRRSVSFSDGKREGPIKGLGRATTTDDNNSMLASKGDGSNVLSARSKRIANMMQDLEGSSFEEESPSKTTSSGRPAIDEIQPLGVLRASTNGSVSTFPGGARRVFSRSATIRSPRSNSSSRLGGKANNTFLTECSFGVAHDRLVQVITDVQPFEPYWEQLTSIDLSKKNLESVARLKEFLPKLDSLCLNTNQVSYLSGIPGTVRSLSVASNILTSVTSYSHLVNLENLDISGNDVDSLRQLECLRHLRELRADGNRVSSVDGLQKLDGLVKLSLERNMVREVDLTECRWTRLEVLNLSHNRLENLVGLASASSLILLNLDNNTLRDLDPSGPMPRLRILRCSSNRLRELRVAAFVNLRTLYADDNELRGGGLVKAGRLTKLENLSVRSQRGRGMELNLKDVRDVKRMYLSGNPLSDKFISEPLYNLVYLELAGCSLRSLPSAFASFVPNLRVLNLNYNFVEDVRALEGLGRLTKVSCVGGRVRGVRGLIRAVAGMKEVEVVDFRMNPCTLSWYLPVMVQGEVGGRGEKRGRANGWQELDAKFRRDLPMEAYAARAAYRGMIMKGCGRLRTLDGLGVTEQEREKAGQFVERIECRAKAKQGR